jgi:hypothetical protein
MYEKLEEVAVGCLYRLRYVVELEAQPPRVESDSSRLIAAPSQSRTFMSCSYPLPPLLCRICIHCAMCLCMRNCRMWTIYVNIPKENQKKVD